MAKAKLKTGNRKTSISRIEVRKAIRKAAVNGHFISTSKSGNLLKSAILKKERY